MKRIRLKRASEGMWVPLGKDSEELYACHGFMMAWLRRRGFSVEDIRAIDQSERLTIWVDERSDGEFVVRRSRSISGERSAYKLCSVGQYPSRGEYLYGSFGALFSVEKAMNLYWEWEV